MTLSTHVVDATTGLPSSGVSVTLERRESTRWALAGQCRTDDDGRIANVGPTAAGVYRIRFATGEYFTMKGIATFYPEVSITFEIVEAAAHHHVPLLLSPFAYSTYRGS